MPKEDYLEPTLEDYKKFFDETPVAFIRTDIKTGKILMANDFAAKLLGCDSVETLKATMKTSDLYPAEERKRLIRMIKQQGSVENYELELTLPDKIISVSARLHINCGGKCIEGTLIETTELVNLRRQQLTKLKEISKKLDSKIATLAAG